jgi:hypothetical protein
LAAIPVGSLVVGGITETVIYAYGFLQGYVLHAIWETTSRALASSTSRRRITSNSEPARRQFSDPLAQPFAID